MRYLTFLLVWLIISKSVGKPDPRFYHLSKADGLVSNNILTAIQDDYGFMWFGSIAGLCRYDGRDFKYYMNSTEYSENKSNIITDLERSSVKGDLWIGTKKGLYYYNVQKDSIYKAASIDDINQVKLCDKNSVFISSWQGLIRYFPETGKKKIIKPISALNHVHMKGTRYLVGTEKGLFIYSTQNDQIKKIGLWNSYISSLYVDSHNHVWIGTVNDGLYRYGPDKEFEQVDVNYDFANTTIEDLIEGRHGRIWLSIRDEGIIFFDPESHTYELISPSTSSTMNLNSDVINRIYKDADGNIWLATFNKGVAFYNTYQKPFHHYKFGFSDHGLQNDFVKSAFCDNQGRIWIGTKKYLHQFRPEEGTFLAYQLPVDADLKAMAQIDDHRLALGTIGNGLMMFDIRTKQFGMLPKIQRHLSENDYIFELYKDRHKNLWVSVNKKGIYVFDEHLSLTKHFSVDKGSYRHFSNVRSIIQDHTGHYWIGTYAGGVFVIDESLTIIENYIKRPANNSISNNDINYLHEGDKGEIWIGTRGGGLNKFDMEDSTFSVVSTRNGLASNYIWGILEDQQGHLWVSTSNGISKLSNNGNICNFDKHDGLQGYDFDLGACVKTSQGHLIFGSSNGFNYFAPQKIQLSPLRPEVYITDFSLFNQEVTPHSEHSILDKQVFLKEKIILDHSQSVFTIGFSALSYPYSYNTKFAYKLRGKNNRASEGWIPIEDNKATITFTSLFPGEYEITIRATNSDGIWSNKMAMLSLVILPPWWQSHWFYMGMATILALILYGLHKFSIRRIKLLNTLKFERMQHKKKLEMNRLKLDLFTNLSHEIKTPLSLIIAPVDKLSQHITPNDYEGKKYIQLIHRSAEQLTRTVNQLLDYRKLESGLLKLELQYGDIVKFIRETTDSFAPLAMERDIRLHFASNLESHQCVFDADKLEKTLYNLLSNALKFTGHHGMVKVGMVIQEGNYRKQSTIRDMKLNTSILTLAIEDNGAGIDAEDIHNIFDRFYQSSANAEAGSGIGLALVRELVQIHHGRIKVESELGRGSKFIVVIPVGEDYYDQLGFKAVSKNEEGALEEEVFDDHWQKAISANIVPKNAPELLIVDDDQDLRVFLKLCLERSYNIVEASNGAEGVQKAFEHIPDLIISDVVMPELNGMDLCKTLKKDERTNHVPIILLTAKGTSSHHVEGLKYGVDDYISKPFNVVLLEEKVKNLISTRRRLREKYQKELRSIAKSFQHEDPLIKKVYRLIDSQIENPELNAKTIADEVGMSTKQLYRKVKSVTGYTVAVLIRLYRMQVAAELLKEQQSVTIADIAYRVGFSDPNYFSSVFKKTFGKPPSELVS